MPTTTETRVNDLIINKMSKAQFDALQEKSPTELYIVEGDSNVIYAEQAVALPVASADNLGKLYQYIGATDANYTQNYFYKCVSSGSPAVYSWQQVNVQPAVDPLPSQSGQSGKFLTTDGTDASWANALQNTATGTDALTILGNATASAYAVNIGKNSKATNWYDTVIGYNANASGQNTGGVSVGYNTKSFDGGIAIGGDASDSQGSNSVVIGISGKNVGSRYGIAIGSKAQLNYADHAIQLGSTGTATTNSDANTFKVANQNGNYEIMSADGTIPTDRFTTTPVAAGTYSASITIDGQGNVTRSWATAPDPLPSQTGQSGKFLTTDGTTASWATVDALPSQTGNAGKVLSTNGTTASWVDMTTTPATTPVLQGGSTYWIEDQQTHVISQTINVTGVTANNVVMVSPIPVNADEYAENGVICTTQAAGTLTFTCKTIPTNDLSVNVVCF